MRLLLVCALLAFWADQASKWVVFGRMGLWEKGTIDVFPPLLSFRAGMNTGINFGLFSDSPDAMRYILIAVALGISVGLIWWAQRSFTRLIEFAAAGLIVGGALGNVLDRILYPGVLDFLNMSCCGINNPFVFNLADVFIFAGAIGLVIFGGEKKGA